MHGRYVLFLCRKQFVTAVMIRKKISVAQCTDECGSKPQADNITIMIK